MKAYQLPKEFAEKWIAALRSGEYKQITGKLYDKWGFCCLGVGCDISGIEREKMFYHGDIRDLVLEYEACDYVKLNKEFGIPLELIDTQLAQTLMKLNDGAKDIDGNIFNNLSFSEIADWIENNVEFK